VSTDQPVRLVAYDLGWPAAFARERAALLPAVTPHVVGGVHHVGSTAVPGLAAKPTIDIMVGIAGLDEARGCLPALEALDYHYAPYRTDEMHWLCKPDPIRRTHHLHLVPAGSPRFAAALAFRDHLRAHADVARQYETLKQQLAARFADDRDAYTEAKADFILEIVARELGEPTARS
jgi:GrpB-like predicted nucleotidyltransferase (UPF0157 family)